MLPASNLSKTQIDRVGDRLRKGEITDFDLQILDIYRRSFASAYEHVVENIRTELGLDPVGREKTNTSIIDKLRRQSIRLSQIQDIAGCRIVVADISKQEEALERLKALFPDVDLDDRRERPSHGYRAVHVIVRFDGKSIEIQVRTSLQHWWAELSEKFSDLINPAIKYGGGDAEALDSLSVASDEIIKVENDEKLLKDILAELASRGGMSEDAGRDLLKAQRSIAARRKQVINLIGGMGEIIPED
jgi:putative GTP pyrophosphokinase